MTTIVNFPRRKPKNTNAGPCRVVFHSTTFRDERGAEKTVNVAVTIADGDFQGVIDAAREIGGMGRATRRRSVLPALAVCMR